MPGRDEREVTDPDLEAFAAVEKSERLRLERHFDEQLTGVKKAVDALRESNDRLKESNDDLRNETLAVLAIAKSRLEIAEDQLGLDKTAARQRHLILTQVCKFHQDVVAALRDIGLALVKGPGVVAIIAVSLGFLALAVPAGMTLSGGIEGFRLESAEKEKNEEAAVDSASTEASSPPL